VVVFFFGGGGGGCEQAAEKSAAAKMSAIRFMVFLFGSGETLWSWGGD